MVEKDRRPLVVEEGGQRPSRDPVSCWPPPPPLVEEGVQRPSRDPSPQPATTQERCVSVFGDARCMPWVYILTCCDGSTYVGSTTDLERRVWQHQNGEGAAYTRRRRPVELAWCQDFDRVDEAWAFEKRLQTWGRAKRLALI